MSRRRNVTTNSAISIDKEQDISNGTAKSLGTREKPLDASVVVPVLLDFYSVSILLE